MTADLPPQRGARIAGRFADAVFERAAMGTARHGVALAAAPESGCSAPLHVAAGSRPVVCGRERL